LTSHVARSLPHKGGGRKPRCPEKRVKPPVDQKCSWKVPCTWGLQRGEGHEKGNPEREIREIEERRKVRKDRVALMRGGAHTEGSSDASRRGIIPAGKDRQGQINTFHL